MNGDKCNKEIWLFSLSICCFFLWSISFLLMPIDLPGINRPTQLIIVGSLFWGFSSIGVVLQYILAVWRKKWARKNRIYCGRYFYVAKAGLFAFFQNIYGLIADVVCGISLISCLITILLLKLTGIIPYISIAVFTFAFCMHCILNGKTFFYIQNKNKFLSKKEKANQQQIIEKENEND